MLPRRGSLDDAQERLLRQVLCSGAISQHPHEEGEEGPAVAAQQVLERARIALLELRQQLLVCLLSFH